MRATGPLTDSSARRDALLGHYHAAQGTAAGASPHPELAPCRPAQRQPRPNEKDGNGEVRRDPLDQRPLCLARGHREQVRPQAWTSSCCVDALAGILGRGIRLVSTAVCQGSE